LNPSIADIVEAGGESMATREGVSRAVHAMSREVGLLVELERSAVIHGTALDGLRASWNQLVCVLELEQVERTMKCPHCGRPGESDALHCWTCWEQLAPAAPDAGVCAGGEGRS
jgi:hypothetical protein